MLTTFDLDEYVYEALRAGANGFLLKDVPRAILVGACARSPPASRCCAAITRRLMTLRLGAARRRAPPHLDLLTRASATRCPSRARPLERRDRRELVLSQATVKTHVAAVLRKLDLRDRTQAVVWAYDRDRPARGARPSVAPVPRGGAPRRPLVAAPRAL